MSKEYTEQDEQRIRELNKKINEILHGELAEALQELFDEVYGGMCVKEYVEILSSLVLIEGQELPVAEMKYKRIGEFEDADR